MKKRTSLIVLLLIGLCAVRPTPSRAQDIDKMSPVVVKTFPEAGARDVAPGVAEIRITFSKPMKDQSWSWSTGWQDSAPEIVDKPHYLADGRTCVMKVKLEAGKTYGWWLNSQRFHGFQDRDGQPAVPYLFVFKVKDP